MDKIGSRPVVPNLPPRQDAPKRTSADANRSTGFSERSDFQAPRKPAVALTAPAATPQAQASNAADPVSAAQQAYDAAQQAAADSDRVLGQELASMPSMSAADRAAYIAAYKKAHADVYDKVKQTGDALSAALSQAKAAYLASDPKDPAQAKAIYDGYADLAKDPDHAAEASAFAYALIYDPAMQAAFPKSVCPDPLDDIYAPAAINEATRLMAAGDRAGAGAIFDQLKTLSDSLGASAQTKTALDLLEKYSLGEPIPAAELKQVLKDLGDATDGTAPGHMLFTALATLSFAAYSVSALNDVSNGDGVAALKDGAAALAGIAGTPFGKDVVASVLESISKLGPKAADDLATGAGPFLGMVVGAVSLFQDLQNNDGKLDGFLTVGSDAFSVLSGLAGALGALGEAGVIGGAIGAAAGTLTGVGVWLGVVAVSLALVAKGVGAIQQNVDQYNERQQLLTQLFGPAKANFYANEAPGDIEALHKAGFTDEEIADLFAHNPELAWQLACTPDAIPEASNLSWIAQVCHLSHDQLLTMLEGLPRDPDAINAFLTCFGGANGLFDGVHDRASFMAALAQVMNDEPDSERGAISAFLTQLADMPS